MNVFEAVKVGVTARQAAELYGIRTRKDGMECCPFHDDRHPSMKLDKRYHCFGCQADGDVIDFTAGLFGLGLKDAAEKLAADFGIGYDKKGKGKGTQKRASAHKKISDIQKMRNAERQCYRVLSDYYHLLLQWQEEFKPQPGDGIWHPLFVEALQKRSHIGYMLDILLDGTAEEKALLIAGYGKEVQKIGQRISEYPAVCPAGRAERGRSHAAEQER